MPRMYLPADEGGNTPLHYAAHADNLESVSRLLQEGHDVLRHNASGLTPLHFAAFGGNVDVLERLLAEAPRAINHQSIKGSSLLHEAIRGRSLEIVNFLMDKGAETNLQDEGGDTPLHLAARLKPAGICANICQALLRRGADPTIQNQVKENFVFALLRGAASLENLELLITLALQHRTDLLSRNVAGLTALDEARKMKAPLRIIRLLQNKTQEQQMEFLRDRPLPSPVAEVGHPSARPRKKVKLFICGHSGVGKTTFVNTLKETGILSRLHYYLNGSESPPSTQGVSCSQADLKDGSLIIWDFAGQMEYCFTHSLLLNTSGPNTVYCVVFSLKGIESDLHGAQRQAIDQMIFWLRFLSSAHNSDSAPHVVLLGSHLDTLPEENQILIAQRFYENVMSRETDLFNCFQKQFSPINCKRKSDVEPIKDALEVIVADIEQEAEPEICQLVMEHLSQQRVRFQRWREFVASITGWLAARGRAAVCPPTLLTAVEYLHNISELLYLPQYVPSRANSPANGDSPSPEPSGVIILDMNWLLQKIFARFGTFALSPASGTDKHFWSFREVVGALGLANDEGDSRAALDLLESLELLLGTPQGDYVVPAWLKRRGLPRRRWQHQRGVVYRWKNESRVIFSHFFIGRLQIQLVRLFGKERCKLWKGGALVVAEAQARIEVSEDKRSIYLIGCWGDRDKEGDCYRLLTKVETEVETLLRNGWDQSCEKLHLCPVELRDVTEASCGDGDHQPPITEDIQGYSFQEILNAEDNQRPLGARNVPAWQVLFPQHDTRILRHFGWKCSTRFMEGSTLDGLCHLLDEIHPPVYDWRLLAEHLGEATIGVVKQMEEEARSKRLSPTWLVLQRYPATMARLQQALREMKRDDCMAEIEKMMGADGCV